MQPLLSVVTATYRDPGGLRRTIQSLSGLSGFESWEHIIVDSSPEESAPALAGIAVDHPLRLVVAAPRGIYAAMNEGLNVASGRWVWFLNGGDRAFQPNELVSALEREDATVAVHGLLGRARYFRDGKYAYTDVPKTPWWRGLLGACHLCQQSVFWRREVFQRVGCFNEDYTLAGDYEHHIRCWLDGLRVKMLQQEVCEFDRGGRSETLKSFDEYRTIHARLGGGLPLGLRIVMRSEWSRQYYLARLVYRVKDTSAAEHLRPLWWRYQRVKGLLRSFLRNGT